MRKLIFLFYITLSITLCAQPKINWGDIQTNNHTGSDYLGVKTEDDQNLYMLKKDHVANEHNTWYLECISKQAKKIVYSKPLLIPNTPDKKLVKWNTIVTISNKLYLLSSYYDNTGLFNVYASDINTSTGDIQTTKLIYTTTVYTKKTPTFHYTFSPDKSKMLICPVPFDLQNSEAKIVDENMQDVWKGIITIPVLLSPLHFFELIMDNGGDIGIYNVYYTQDNTPVDPLIILYNTATERGNVLNVAVPSEYILYSETLKLYQHNKLYFAAFLCDTSSSGRTAGMISAFVDLEKQEYLNAQSVIFDKQKANELVSVGKRGGGFFLGLYFIKNIFFRPNGTITLLAEQEGYDVYDYEYFSNLTFACNLTVRGYINWLTLIPKYQTHAVKEYLGFATGYDDNNIYLVFNDNYKNANITGNDSPRCMDNLNKCVTVMVSVDDYGTSKKQVFYSEDEASYLSIKPILCSKLKNNQLLLFAEKENAIRLGEVLLK
jgi:hypothetical protein